MKSERQDFIFNRVGYKLFHNILAALYRLLFKSYEMHLWVALQ